MINRWAIKGRITHTCNYLKTHYRKVSEVCEKIKPNAGVLYRLRHVFGFLINYLVLKCSISDYFAFSLYKKSWKEKRTYANLDFRVEYIYTVNDRETVHKCGDKVLMSKLVGAALGRDWLSTDAMSYEDFCSFAEKHEFFIFKPTDGEQGRGVEKWHCTPENRDELFRQAKESSAILDEVIEQHPDLNALCPSSVNTIRYYTFAKGTEIITMGCILRMGRGDSLVDNYSSGGLAAMIDPETGKLLSPAQDKYGVAYDRHPYTGTEIVGFQLPLWDKVRELVLSAAVNYPIAYLGWDIAVRSDDCVVVETNPAAGFQTPQIFGGGKRAMMEDFMAYTKAHPENIRKL